MSDQPAGRGTSDADAGTAWRWWRGAATAATRADARRRRAGRAGRGTPTVDRRAGPIATGAAAVKLVLIGAGGLVGGPVVGRVAARNTAAVTDLAWRYPELVADVLAGGPGADPLNRIARTSAAARVVITSDLHRGVPGTTDWPGLQDTDRLYAAMLDVYAAGEWSLVENGDVEDFWMVGGSAYGVVYELGRWAGHAVRTPSGRRFLGDVYGEHLRRIVAHNAEVYDRIEQGFHSAGRYHRIVGNHDDVYLDEAAVEHLRQVHPSLDVLDALVLDGPGGGVGLVTHGHHTDGWNAPRRSGLGKLGTWLGSTVADAPFTAANPGLPGAEETQRLLVGDHASVLTEVSPLFGANRELYSMDEVVLFEAWREHFGAGDGPRSSPWLVLGHTHLPLTRPVDPRGRRSWERYANTGSGVFAGLVTAIEWDGTRIGDGVDPEVGLVAWHWADADTPDEAVVTEIDGRPVARRRLVRPDGVDHVIALSEPATVATPVST